MKHAWLVALAISFLLSAPAEARKECEPAVRGEGLAIDDDSAAAAEDRWPHDTSGSWVHASDSDWVHENASGAWVHAGAGDAVDADVDPVTDASWVHETDYGWWAATPNVALAGPDEEEIIEPEEDCTVARERNECVVLGNQVATYRFRVQLAREREDERWEEMLLQTIDGLEARATLYGCTWVEPSLRVKIVHTINAVVEAAGVAAQVAAMMYRMGLL